MKEWEIYQRLAAEIYADLDPAALVTHDDHILGKNTGIRRQIDVSIRAKIAGHEILIIVQARDNKEPADVNVVGEFKAVIDDVRANKGILVCSGGFTGTASEYAKNLNIDLCRLVDARSRKWGFDLRIPLVWIENPVEVEGNLEITPDRTNDHPIVLGSDVAQWKVSRDFGATSKPLGSLFADAWNEKRIPRTRNVWLEHAVKDADLRVLLGDKDFWCPVTIAYRYRCNRTAWLGSLSLKSLRGVLNFSEQTLRAKVSISPTELPGARDQNWEKLDDPDKFFSEQPAVISCEFEELDAGSMHLTFPGFQVPNTPA